MTLHKKTLIVMGIALFCLVLVLYLNSSSILLSGFSEVEDEQMRQNVGRAVDTIADDLDNFADVTRDWAAWDDTYYFIDDGNEEYIDSNIDVSEAWTLNRVDAMVYVDADGEVIFSNSYDLEEEEFIPVSENLLSFIDEDETLLSHPDLEGHAGIVLLPEGPMLLSSQPITTSEEDAPANGSLVWARYLNESQVERLAAITHTNLSIETFANEDLPADFIDARASLSGAGDTFITPLDDETVAGYAVLDDINQEAALILKVDEERAIFAQGQTTTQYVLISIVVVGIIFAFITMLIMERMVLSRVARISSDVSDIEMKGDHSSRLKVTGSDELASMSVNINNMLTALEEAQSALRDSHIKLEEKVRDRTVELSQKVAALKTLAEISKEIMVATDVEAIYDLVCKRASYLFNAPKVIIAVKNSREGSHIASSYGLKNTAAAQDDMKQLLKTGFFDHDDPAGKGHYSFESFSTENGMIPKLLKRERIRAAAIAPMVAEGKSLGALFLFDCKRRKWKEDEIQVMELLASQVALALDTTHLLQEEQQRRGELTSLYELSRVLADTAPDIDTILSLVVEHVVNNLQVTFARFTLLEDDQLVGQAAFPRRIIGHDMMVKSSEPLASLPYCRKIIEQGEAVILSDDTPGISEKEQEILFLETARNVCVIPLIGEEGPLGLLIMGEARDAAREPLTTDKLHMAKNICDQTASTLRRAELFSEIEKAYLQTVLALANAVDAKDTYTADHGSRLAALSLAIGQKMKLSPRELDDMRYGSLLHDVGKIGIPDAILQKPAKLTEEEWEEMRKHPDIGAQILAPVPFLVGAARVVRHHHERIDGGGYPEGLVGDSIPVGARILAVVDSYCAMRDKRVYKDERPHEEAVQELLNCSGKQFDAMIVDVFLQIIELGEIDVEAIVSSMDLDEAAIDDIDEGKDSNTEAA
jgi:HD-GYP domain-containing protein (c-di-GMP phosphodiesterase class II)/sensor domain CHASE-containing protein